MSMVISGGNKYHQENEIGVVPVGDCGEQGRLLIWSG